VRVLAARRHRRDVGLHRLAWIVLHGLPTFGADALGPGPLFYEWRGPQERAVGSVDGVAKAVAIRLERQLERLALHGDISEHRLGNAVIIEGIVGRVLEVPLDLAGVSVESNGAVSVEVVAWPISTVPVRPWIADAPIDQIELGVVRAGNPGRPAARLPGVVTILPAVVAGLALSRDRVGAPHLLAGLQIGSGEPTANSVLGTRNAGNR